MKILNGATIGDTTGEYTCVTYNGLSVVDYFIASYGLITNISSVTVNQFTEISDHRPLFCVLKGILSPCLSLLESSMKFMDKPIGYKWNNCTTGDSSEAFLATQNHPRMKQKIADLCSKECALAEDVHSLNQTLVSTVNEIAASSLQKKKQPSGKRFKKMFGLMQIVAKKSIRLAN